MSAIFGELLTFGQENGPDIRLRVFGDEHYARYETVDGYTVVYDEGIGQFCYARLAAGAFRSTGMPASGAPPAGLVRHLQETQPVTEVKARRVGPDGPRSPEAAMRKRSCARSARSRDSSRAACSRAARSRG